MEEEMEIRELQTESLGVPAPLNIDGKAVSTVTQHRIGLQEFRQVKKHTNS